MRRCRFSLKASFEKLVRADPKRRGNKQGDATTPSSKLAQLSESDLHQCLVDVNRAPILKSRAADVRPVLREVRARVASLSHTAVRDGIVAANSSGHHELCVDIFLKRAESHSRDIYFSVVDAVADSGFKLGAESIVKVAKVASERVSSFPSDHPSDLALCRIFWRATMFDMEQESPTVAAAVWDLMARGSQAPGFQSTSFAQAKRSIGRFIRYGRERDSGEMHSMRWLVDRQLCRSSVTKPLQLYVNLLRSCKSGQWPHEAASIYAEYAAANNIVDDVLTHAYISVLQAAKEYGLIADLGEQLLNEDDAPSTTVIAMIAQAASELPRPQLVLRCYDLILDQADSQSTSRYAAFACLTGIGKCGVVDFMARLETCVERGIIEDSAEARCYLVLQYANYAVDPKAAASPAVDAIRTGAVAPTERIYNQLFQLYLRIDSDEMVSGIAAAASAGFRRTQWAELLLTWADRRRYELTPKIRQEILEIVRGYGIRDVSDHLPSCRPMLALLQHDETTSARQVLQQEGRVVDPPRLMDPRVHFLRTRRHAVHAPRPSTVRPSLFLPPNSSSAQLLLDGFLARSMSELQHVPVSDSHDLLAAVRELP